MSSEVKIQYMSDLHIENKKNYKLPPKSSELLVLAGDIGNIKNSETW